MPDARLDVMEATLSDLLPRLSPAPARRGRPEILPGVLLWAGLLVVPRVGAFPRWAWCDPDCSGVHRLDAPRKAMPNAPGFV